MKIPEASLTDVDRYMANNPLVPIEEHRAGFDKYLRHLRRFRNHRRNSQLLEIGVGTGWFPILCGLEGLRCKGLEISPQLVEYAKRYGQQYGVEPDIEIGNVESADLGSNLYDGIIVSFVFEHVEQWRAGPRARSTTPSSRAACSTSSRPTSSAPGRANTPCPSTAGSRTPGVSGLRKVVHGPDIMKLGIDFNEFTYPELRREFRHLGFARSTTVSTWPRTPISAPVSERTS